MTRFSPRTLVLFFCLALGLAACQSSEERAEEHFQSALELLEAGDLDRATVEFRNVFALDGNHVEARRAYASALREAGRFETAYGQYLRLAEQVPDDLGARIALAEMAIDASDWEEALRHGNEALEMAPDDPAVGVIGISLGYAQAIEDEDETARREAADAARALVAEAPGNLSLQRVLIDDALRDGDMDTALASVDAALAIEPDLRPLHDVRLSILAEQEDASAVEAQLGQMIGLFPEDETLVGTLLRFYAARGENDAAEDFLRAGIGSAGDSDRYAVSLVQFVLETRGAEAALAEIASLREADPDTGLYHVIEASIRFDMGDTEDAIAQMQGLIERTEPSVAQNDAKITLARMLVQTGNAVGAQRLVEEVLEADATQVEALKMQAAWLIESDAADEAIALLRTALDQSPQDAEAMALMAGAHQRNGNPELRNDFLDLAVEASGNAPEQSLRYAAVLVGEERYLLAEEVLIEALRIVPGELSLLNALGEVYIAMNDWPRARQVERRLATLGTETGNLDATRAAAGLEAGRLAAQGRTADAVGVLEELAGDAEGGDLAIQVAVVRAHLASGDVTSALSYATELLDADPENPALRLTMGLTQAAAGQGAASIATFEALTADEPQFERAWIELVRSHTALDQTEAAEAALAAGLEALPDGVNLLWAQAGTLERAGDVDGAIAIYDALYARIPNSEIVANNLASLISSYRDDDESLERAYAIARRLRGSEVSAFADTYGWIAFRRGDLREAESHLERAAEGLPNDPLVQAHYGLVLAATEQNAAALAQLTLAVALAGDDDTRAQIMTARDEITRLEAALAAAGDTEDSNSGGDQ